jgi:hypothetical protein
MGLELNAASNWVPVAASLAATAAPGFANGIVQPCAPNLQTRNDAGRRQYDRHEDQAEQNNGHADDNDGNLLAVEVAFVIVAFRNKYCHVRLCEKGRQQTDGVASSNRRITRRVPRSRA